MSQENVEIVWRFYAATQRSLDAYWKSPRSGVAAMEAGDLDPETEAVLAFLDPAIEYNNVAAAVEGGTARGHRGWLRTWDAFLEASEEFSATINELADLGGDKVFVAAKSPPRTSAAGWC